MRNFLVELLKLKYLKNCYFLVFIALAVQGYAQPTEAEKTVTEVKKKKKKNRSLPPIEIDTTDYGYKGHILTIGAGAGFCNFMGDLSNQSEISGLTGIRAAYQFSLERRFLHAFSLSLNGLYGSLAYNEVGMAGRNKNFESEIMAGGASLLFHFDNDLIMPKRSRFSPYIGAGVNYLLFDPYGDLENGKGKYYYWSNGLIYDQPENPPASDNANELQRDYIYETKLTDTANDYARNTLTFPITAGLKFKLTRHWQARIFTSLNITSTDWIDNTEMNGDNDMFVHSGFSINYTFRKRDKSKEDEIEYDFSELDASDTDGDGVNDLNDLCANTPKNIEVDKKGCPFDDDKDGVPNYLDKEPETERGATVDESGVSLTDEMLAERRKGPKITEERLKIFSKDPAYESMKKFDDEIKERLTENNTQVDPNRIPAELRAADANNDGIIVADEITGAIDDFFEGTNGFTVSKLNDLIDYFFEQ